MEPLRTQTTFFWNVIVLSIKDKVAHNYSPTLNNRFLAAKNWMNYKNNRYLWQCRTSFYNLNVSKLYNLNKLNYLYNYIPPHPRPHPPPPHTHTHTITTTTHLPPLALTKILQFNQPPVHYILNIGSYIFFFFFFFFWNYNVQITIIILKHYYANVLRLIPRRATASCTITNMLCISKICYENIVWKWNSYSCRYRSIQRTRDKCIRNVFFFGFFWSLNM